MKEQINVYEVKKGKLNHLAAYHKAGRQPMNLKKQQYSHAYLKILSVLYGLSKGTLKNYFSKMGLNTYVSEDVSKFIQQYGNKSYTFPCKMK